MKNKPHSHTFSDVIWDLFISVKFTVVLLLLWLLGSVAGTLIIQNATPMQSVQLYGTTWSNILFRFGFFDVYHSTWYSLILLLLLLNITACTLNTYKSKYALAFIQPKKKSVNGTGKRFLNYSIKSANPETDIEKLKDSILKKYPDAEVFEQDGQKRIFAHKQPWSHFMVYLVHLSLVLIILGGMITASLGFEGVMEIPEKGEVDYVFKKTDKGYMRENVPFSVRCDEFTFQKFENGMPKDYVSRLTIIENEKEMLTKTIEVNDPLSFKSYNFYQSSYRELAPLEIFSIEQNKSVKINVSPGETNPINEFRINILVEGFQASNDGMMASVLWAGESDDVNRVMLSGDTEKDKKMQGDGKYIITFSQDSPAYITGLLISSDPGVWLVWLGSFMMIVGLYLTFYSSHRRISVKASENEIIINALTSKNPIAFKREIERFIKAAGLENSQSAKGA